MSRKTRRRLRRQPAYVGAMLGLVVWSHSIYQALQSEPHEYAPSNED